MKMIVDLVMIFLDGETLDVELECIVISIECNPEVV
jgi:hypothetical protein